MRVMTWVAALVSAGLSVSAGAAAVGFGPSTVQPAAHLFTVGKLKLATLHEGQLVVPNDSKTFGVGVDPATVAEVLRKAGAPTDRIT